MDFVRLRSGRAVAIRPIAPEDDHGLRAAYDRLSTESKYSRFLSAKPHLSAADARYLVQIDGADHVALVATPADRPGYILAVARFVRLIDQPGTAEFAVVVGDPFQREGLATVLLEHLAQAATERGIRRFRATMFAGNAAADRLVATLAGRRAGERHVGPIDEIEIDLVGRRGDRSALAA